jgi:glucuronate isomerase
VDSLKAHKNIRKDGFEIKVIPAWRPDKSMAVENTTAYNKYLDILGEVTDIDITKFSDLIKALTKRHKYFHKQGCRLSDHGLETFYSANYTESEVKSIFNRVRSGNDLSAEEVMKIKSALLHELAIMDHETGWTQQFHYGAIRNNNSRLLKKLGPDTGFDSIGDFEVAKSLSTFLNNLDKEKKLTKTILYNLNPRDNELIATMIGNFQDGSVPGKIQFGSGWWFLDQKEGITRQLNALSNMGLLSRFIGMLTDSRSFLSYPRHEYFRRILCNLLGNDVENGEIPDDMKLLGQMVENICYYNAKNYFDFDSES